MQKTPFVWLEGRGAVPDPSLIQIMNLPLSVIESWIGFKYPAGSLQHDIMCARAYDNAYGTSTSAEYAVFDVDSDIPW